MDPEERGQPIRLENFALLVGALFSFAEYLKTSRGMIALICMAFAIWSFIDSTFSVWIGVFLLTLVGVDFSFFFIQEWKAWEEDEETES